MSPGNPPSPEKRRQKNLLYSGVLGFTATYRYGETLRTLVARAKAECNMNARELWGEWDGEPCYSNPASIYRDLIGETYQRRTRRGFHAAMTGRAPRGGEKVRRR